MATVARTPDAELLRRLRARDRQAWEELYAEYQPRLRAFAYRLAGNVHDADDLVQETFVRAVPRLDRLDPETAEIAPYLFTTLRNLFLKQVERGKRQQPVAEVPEPALPAPVEDDPQRSLLLAGQQEEVRVANARLQPRQRLVLALRELEERSYAEIGELVGMKENAVAQLIFRARESLRTELRLVQVDPERLPEECRRFLPLLAAHLDGQLKGARRDETLEHLDGCERCQAALVDMREASRRYRVILLPIGADEARAAVDERLEAAGYWQSGGSRRFLVRRPALIVLAGAAGLLLAAAGTALGVELARSPERAVLESVPTAPPAATEGPVRGTDAVETVVPIVPKATTTAAAKPKQTKKTASKPKLAAKAKAKPATTTAVSPPTPKATATEPTPKLTHVPKPKPAPKPKPEAEAGAEAEAGGAGPALDSRYGCPGHHGPDRHDHVRAGTDEPVERRRGGLPGQRGRGRLRLQARRRRLRRLHEPGPPQRPGLRSPHVLGPRHGQSGQRRPAGLGQLDVRPARHDPADRRDHRRAVRLDHRDVGELHLLGRRGGLDVPVLARRVRVQRLPEPGLLLVALAGLALVLGEGDRPGRQHGRSPPRERGRLRSRCPIWS